MAGFRIGVVIPACNAGGWIGDCLGSLLYQGYEEWSAVVIDDGSTDDTADRVRRIADSRVQLIQQANAGVSAARNRGIQLVAGCDAVLFLDADDWLAADAFERLGNALRKAPGAVAAAGPAAFVRPDGSVQSLKPAQSGDLLDPLLVRNLFANGGHVLIRTSATRCAGYLSEELRFGEDWDYFVRLALLGPFAAVAGGAPVLFVRRLHSGAYSRLACDPLSHTGCLDAVFGNPGVQARFEPNRLARLRVRAETEAQWAVGRALLTRAQWEQGRGYLRRSVARRPSAKRLMLLAAAYVPSAWRMLTA